MTVQSFFPTLIYEKQLISSTPNTLKLNKQLLSEIFDIAQLDLAGESWSQENYKNGFTSYASANELHKMSSTFFKLEQKINQHVKAFSKALDFDLGGHSLKMVTCWANVMHANTHHGMHIHPLSVISGTYYVKVPKGSSPIKFEDPRLSKFMGAPPRKVPCKKSNLQFVELFPKAGNLVLFESWLRHEVPIQQSKEPRISISFNYAWE